MKGTEQGLHSCLEQRISVTICWIRDSILNSILQTWAPMLFFNNNLVWIVRDMALVLFLWDHGLGVRWGSLHSSARRVVVQLVHPCADQWGSEMGKEPSSPSSCKQVTALSAGWKRLRVNRTLHTQCPCWWPSGRRPDLRHLVVLTDFLSEVLPWVWTLLTNCGGTFHKSTDGPLTFEASGKVQVFTIHHIFAGPQV